MVRSADLADMVGDRDQANPVAMLGLLEGAFEVLLPGTQVVKFVDRRSIAVIQAADILNEFVCGFHFPNMKHPTKNQPIAMDSRIQATTHSGW